MFNCPVCGEPVRDDAQACPSCGSDDETGWDPDADDLSVELPEDEDEESYDHTAPPRGDYSAFAYFLIAVGVLGFIALGRFSRLGWSTSLIGVFVVVTVILLYVRRSVR